MELPPQLKTTCRSLNMIGKAVVFIPLCLCLNGVQADRKIYASQGNFFPAGEVASPCYFHEVGLSVPISYLLSPHSMLMVLHIPFVADGRYHLRKLYEVGTVVLTGTGRLVKFTPEVPFTSVDQRSETHQLMTAADLERCIKIGSVRLCPDMSILQKQVSSCITALYHRQTLKASLLCSSTLEFNKNVFQVNGTAYAIRKGVEVQLQCPKQDPQFFAIKENKVQIVPRGCKLMGPDFVVIKTMSK